MQETVKYREGAAPNRPPRERAGGRGSNGAPEVLVCLFSGEGVECVHLKRRPVLQAASFTIHSPEEARQRLAKTHKNCRIVGIMPKERYLIKTATLPSVAAKEEQALLALDVEAGLPSEYGPAEVSFRRLEGQDAQKKRYEVYVCRRGDLETVVQGLAQVGLRAQAILPSAAIWAGAIPLAGGVDLLVASSRRMGWVEVASLGAEGLTSVRAFRAAVPAEGAGLDPRLVELIRAAMAREIPGGGPLTLGWIGSDCPDIADSDRMRVQNVTARFVPRGGDAAPAELGEPLAHVAAATLLEADWDQMSLTAALRPQQEFARAHRRAVFRTLAMGMAALLLSLGLVYAALQVAIRRCENAESDLRARIARIQVQGRRVERRVSQLQAIRAAGATSQVFYDVLWGLHASTPDGITYNQIDLTPGGEVCLRGQASSVSQPFLLPERLEEQSAFRNAVLETAGQKGSSAGLTTEFRATCQLKPKGKP